jgi:hypothetical protein
MQLQESSILDRRHGAFSYSSLRRSYSEVTGSVIDEERSTYHQSPSSIWNLSVFAARNEFGVHSATTGQDLLLMRYEVDGRGSPAVFAFSMPSVVVSPATVLDSVRDVFGLNISETAEVFGITRQTAYQWLKLTTMEQVRARENRERLKQLYGATQTWKGLPLLKGRWLHALLPSGHTVLDLLKAPQVDLNALRSAHEALASCANERRIQEGERTTQAVSAIAAAFAGLGAGRQVRKGAA